LAAEKPTFALIPHKLLENQALVKAKSVNHETPFPATAPSPATENMDLELRNANF
jgi:hypothetical protein